MLALHRATAWDKLAGAEVPPELIEVLFGEVEVGVAAGAELVALDDVLGDELEELLPHPASSSPPDATIVATEHRRLVIESSPVGLLGETLSAPTGVMCG